MENRLHARRKGSVHEQINFIVDGFKSIYYFEDKEEYGFDGQNLFARLGPASRAFVKSFSFRLFRVTIRFTALPLSTVLMTIKPLRTFARLRACDCRHRQRSKIPS